jgi:hypothetical protein
MFAITFTLNACGDDSKDDGNGGDPNNGSGVPFNENSQVYNEDGTLYKGSGNIKIPIYDEDWNILEYVNAGNVINGIVTWNLFSTTIPNNYLKDFPGDEEDESSSVHKNCTFPKDIKASDKVEPILTNNDGKSIGSLSNNYTDEQIYEVIGYIYFSKAFKINCNYEQFQEGRYNSAFNMDIDVTTGWNKWYTHLDRDENYARGVKEGKISTNNILTKELKWVLFSDD